MSRPLPGQGDIWDALVEAGEMAERPRQCGTCGLILTPARTGRRLVYCSAACRQVAYRARVSSRGPKSVMKLSDVDVKVNP